MSLRCIKPTRIALVAVVSVSISSCASLGKQDCLTGDWVSIGKKDGAAGKIAENRLASHAKACNKHGVQFDSGQYVVGHADGLKVYCTTENGFSIGTEFVDAEYSKGYNNVCPADLKLGFLEGYIGGLKLGLDNTYKELNEDRDELGANQGAFLILKALNSSRADSAEERLDETNEDISDGEKKIDKVINEIRKWLQVEPELESLLK